MIYIYTFTKTERLSVANAGQRNHSSAITATNSAATTQHKSVGEMARAAG